MDLFVLIILWVIKVQCVNQKINSESMLKMQKINQIKIGKLIKDNRFNYLTNVQTVNMPVTRFL